VIKLHRQRSLKHKKLEVNFCCKSCHCLSKWSSCFGTLVLKADKHIFDLTIHKFAKIHKSKRSIKKCDGFKHCLTKQYNFNNVFTKHAWTYILQCWTKPKRYWTILLTHEHNFVVKYGGTAWCETNILWNLKRKMWGDMVYYIPIVCKSGGTCPLCPLPICAHALKTRFPPFYAQVGSYRTHEFNVLKASDRVFSSTITQNINT